VVGPKVSFQCGPRPLVAPDPERGCRRAAVPASGSGEPTMRRLYAPEIDGSCAPPSPRRKRLSAQPAGNKAVMEIRLASSATKYLHGGAGVSHFSWAIY